MGLFDHSDKRLAAGPTLLLAADPGEQQLLETARRYDPAVRKWRDRLVFTNGVLLHGPITIAPGTAARAGLPEGMTTGFYAGSAIESHRERRSDEAKELDGARLVRGLAVRLGGTTYPGVPHPELALLVSVYAERDVPVQQVISVLEPYSGKLAVEHHKSGNYALTGDEIFFYTAYWPPRVFGATDEPAALGELGRQKLHHWDLHTGTRAAGAHPDLRLKVGEAALALAGQAGGVAIDMFGFRLTAPGDLLGH